MGDGGHPEAGGPCGLEHGGCLWLGGPCCVRSGGHPGGGVPHYDGDRGHPELREPCGVVDRGHPGLGRPHGVENGDCFGVEDPAGECCWEMTPSGFCALRVWGQLRCSVPMTHIPERPLGSFPMADRAPSGPDLDPFPCLAACPSLDAHRVQCGAVPQFTHPPLLYIQISGHWDRWSWGETILLIELDAGSPGTAPCARVMPWPWRLTCLHLYCPALLHAGSSSPACAALPCPSP